MYNAQMCQVGLLHSELVHNKLEDKHPVVNTLRSSLPAAVPAVVIHVQDYRVYLPGIILQGGH